MYKDRQRTGSQRLQSKMKNLSNWYWPPSDLALFQRIYHLEQSTNTIKWTISISNSIRSAKKLASLLYWIRAVAAHLKFWLSKMLVLTQSELMVHFSLSLHLFCYLFWFKIFLQHNFYTENYSKLTFCYDRTTEAIYMGKQHCTLANSSSWF